MQEFVAGFFFLSANMSVVPKIHRSPQPHCDFFLFYDYLSSLSLVNSKSPDAVKNEFVIMHFQKKVINTSWKELRGCV